MAAGSTRLSERLRDKTIAIMEEHEPERVPAAVEAEIERLLTA